MSQRYLVTARKYRPATFDELVAQEHVTETLKNALRLDRLAHAYLFSGPRGVGKTTAARILAKAINCETPPEERPDGAEPCRHCASCETFEAGRSMTIFEIDAASNNKVDDIRELRETVRIPPQGSRKKVYIIDEVHMLSTAAFNALLKTLEEPPPHVLFIFATTEPHKVLPTILSRCQRFDFRRIPVPEITRRLHEICEQEAITADEASLMLIARKGDGALRDALSAFDQAVSLCGTDLRYAELAEALRVVDVDLFFEVTQHITAGHAGGLLQLVDRIVGAGYDLQEFLTGLAEHLRNLLVACTLNDTALIEAAEATRQRYAQTANVFTETNLLRLLMLVDEAETSIKDSPQPRMKLELSMLKMAHLAHTVDLRTALQKLEALEQQLNTGTTLPTDRSSAPAPPAPLRPQPAYQPAPPQPAPSTAAPSVAPPDSKRPAPPPDEEPPAPNDLDSAEEVAPEEMPEALSLPSSPPASSPPTSPPPAPDAPGLDLFGPPALSKTTRSTASPSPEEPNPADRTNASVLQAVASPVATLPLPALQRMQNAWPNYVQTVMTARIHVGALLQHTAPLHADETSVTIGVPDDFHRRLLSSQHDFLLGHLNAETADGLEKIMFVIEDNLPTTTATPETQEIDPYAYMQQQRQENPIVQAIFDKFGGELVW